MPPLLTKKDLEKYDIKVWVIKFDSIIKNWKMKLHIILFYSKSNDLLLRSENDNYI